MKSKPKLMIIEDDDLTNVCYKHFFSKEFELVFCKKDTEFYNALQKNQFDVFIVEIELHNGKGGIELIRELRNITEYADTPIFVVTADATKQGKIIALDSGASKVYNKPINFKVLLIEIIKAYKPTKHINHSKPSISQIQIDE